MNKFISRSDLLQGMFSCFICCLVLSLMSSLEINNTKARKQRKEVEYFHSFNSKVFEVGEIEDIFYKLKNSLVKDDITKDPSCLNSSDSQNIIRNTEVETDFQISVKDFYLENLTLYTKIYFINSNEMSHLAWLRRAVKDGQDNAFVVNLYGDPLLPSELIQKNVYCDTNGALARRFNIIGLPAVVEYNGSSVTVEEQSPGLLDILQFYSSWDGIRQFYNVYFINNKSTSLVK